MPYCLTNTKFDALLREMGRLHDAKNKGYAVEGDPLHNFRACENFGIPMYQGLAVRISDKQSRWQNLVRDADNDQVGESLEDTTMDEAVYLLLFLIALEEYKKLTPPPNQMTLQNLTVGQTPEQYTAHGPNRGDKFYGATRNPESE